MAFPDRYQGVAVTLTAFFALIGCGREDIRSYSAPKETPKTNAVAAMAAAHASEPAPIRWHVPAGWEQQPPGGMRVGSFLVNKDGQRADVSVIPLTGISGSEIDNVNRWRGQVGLPPLDAPKLSEAGEKVQIGSASASLYDMGGTDPQTKQPARILAAILPGAGTTWFFKMTGSDVLVLEQKPAFKEFLKSVRMEAPPAGAAPMASAPLPAMDMKELSKIPGHEGMMGATPAHGTSSSEKPTWDVPSGWTEQAPTSMRVATFAVTGEGGAKADLSVTKLGGTAGGILGNVNRWRAQVGLEPVDEAALEKLISTQDVNGTKVISVEMAGRSVESGEQARVLAAIVSRPGATWFYKMLGDDKLVAQQKDAFTKFIHSARYPNAS